jgi:hypothetical protein
VKTEELSKNLLHEKTFWRVFNTLISVEQEYTGQNISELPERVKAIGNIAKRITAEFLKPYKYS